MNGFLISWNRLSSLQAMCQYLSDTGTTPIIIDNNSSYKPLLKWLSDCPYKVHRMEKNWGHLVMWKSGLINEYKERFYCVSDPDLSLEGIPHDYIEVLMRGLEANPDVFKAGFSLRINDLPENAYTRKVIQWESKFWNAPKDKLGFMRADIDTTMALYDKQRDFGLLPPEGNKFHWAVRSPEPYVCRHLPFYNTPEMIENNPEEKYYCQHTSTYWSERLKETML